MESTRSSRESIKSILIVAGIPLAFSVACSLIARIKDRKISSLQDRVEETEFDQDNGDYINNTHDVSYLKDQIFALRSKTEELQELELEIEDRFFRFIELKDQEHALMEVQNSLLMEKERTEFLEREVSSTEVENKKFDEMVIEYLKALEELEDLRFENGFLRRKVDKMKGSMRKRNSKIEAQEAELKGKENVVGEFERRVEEMRVTIGLLRDEKDEVLSKLDAAENVVTSKAEAELILVENYNQVVNELQRLQKDRTAEVKELIYLRWCHACLKHELARRNQIEQEQKLEDKPITEPQNDGGVIMHDSHNDGMMHHNMRVFGHDESHSKKRWLVKKFKKWVDGNGKDHEVKCFGSHSVIDDAEERHSAGRKSFSSV
ncbi:protein CHUP1, chloroplastic [Cynara cardunculus var. scolymus]|uniref:protein CHUP1, chloroplastic n=1 Tax=Cynara cardunculus var. scolymus TaxID=59895 RepID=UPI000D62C752|nr:protein CHUP1, chloroplastic [Cynara cardunculus var. scolymus]